MDFTLVGLWHEMGFTARAVVVVLIVMSLYALAIAGERLLDLPQGAQAVARLRRGAGAAGRGGRAAARGGRPREAVRRQPGGQGRSAPGCTSTPRPRPARGQRDVVAFDVAEIVNRAMERSKERELAGLRRGMPVLATVASSAPFVGLFGTVGGIITAFQKLADPTKGGGGIGTVSAGIAEALITTAVGLGVAILAVWFYNYFTARLDDLTIDIDETASELVDTILGARA